MSSSSPLFSFFFFFFFFLSSLVFAIANAQVPASETFRFVNEGEFGPFINEYDANYRMISIFEAPFQMGFYNTTPNAYTLALRLGLQRNEPLYRWVWEANRGKPVKENATFSLGTNGNLVLAEADGTVVWQTNTANKGVTGFRLLPNGNMVLHDKKGKFIWQSFDFPTDTLLVGQSLRFNGVSKLVSRLSVEKNVNGPYSLVMEPKGFSVFFKGSNAPKQIPYSTLTVFGIPVTNLTFSATPVTDSDDEVVATELGMVSPSSGSLILARPKYNATVSFLRLGIDGNVRIFTYYDRVDSQPTEETFTLFDRDSIWETECQLPERCGNFGVCDENQCVACPSEKGFLGWSKDCGVKKVNSCKKSDFHYFKVEGVNHFMSKYTSGTKEKLGDCEKKCTSDCKCLGFFHRQETSRCWIAYDLKTLTKVPNSTHVGFIKVPNK